MPYDVELAERIRAVVGGEQGVTERPMFGALAFLVHGHLAASATNGGGLLLRTAPADAESLLAEPHVRPFEMRGREVPGWLLVAPEGVATDDTLRTWVGHGLAYARSLPPK
jgi:hypothetical protein